MRSKILLAALAGAVLAATTGFRFVRSASQPSQEEDSDDTPIDMSAVPGPARETVKKVLGSLDGCEASSEEEHGATLFEIDCPSARTSVKVTADGRLVEVEREVGEDTLPAGAVAALQQRFPGATISGVEEVESHHYGVLFSVGGKRREVELTPTGRMKARRGGGEEHEEHGNDEDGEEDD